MTNDDASFWAGVAMTISTAAHLTSLAIAQKYKFDEQRSQKMNSPVQVWPDGFSPKGAGAKHKRAKGK
jgi:hypothetical protein